MPVVVDTPQVRTIIRENWNNQTIVSLAALSGVSVKTVVRISRELRLPAKSHGFRVAYHQKLEPRLRPAAVPPLARPTWFNDRAEMERRMMAGR